MFKISMETLINRIAKEKEHIEFWGGCLKISKEPWNPKSQWLKGRLRYNKVLILFIRERESALNLPMRKFNCMGNQYCNNWRKYIDRFC